MDFMEWLTEFEDIIEENHPNKDKRTIEDYVATFADHPPVIEEFYTPKCPMEAEVLRVRGNQIFKAGNYEEALIAYTNCIKKAPSYTKCIALAYANRSAASYHLKLWKDCISDIDKALDLPYPDDLRMKIISRREEAMNNNNIVKQEDDDRTKNQQTKNNNNNNTEDKNRIANNNNNNNEKEKKVNKNSIQDLKYGENPKIPGASCGINIIHKPQEGRKLIATMPFQTGDILIIEKPYLMIPEINEDHLYCHHCSKKSFSPIPCEQCSDALYCSEKCRSEAYDSYHRIECRIQYTILSSIPLNIEAIFCQLRCLNVLTEQGNKLNELYNDFKELEETTDPSKLGFTDDDRFIGNSKKAFLSLLFGKEIRRDLGAFFEAGYIVSLLRNYTNFFKTNADVVIVAKLIVKLSHAYAFNHFAIPYFGQTEAIAHATFPLIGLVNHACVNNTITHIDGDGKIVLQASQYIRPGDQIFHDYRDLQFSCEEASNRSGKILQFKRKCKKCDKTFVYPPERQPYIKMDKRLRSKMHKNPYDIEGLWKILNLVRGKHQHYTLQAQIIKNMLVSAYEGRTDLVLGHTMLHMFGIL